MDSLSPQVVSTAKIPILNPNEFDLWKMRIEQYFLMTDYSLWEVILNGDSLVPTRIVEGVVQPVAPTTDEQKLARKNELKARGTLLMALLDKHQLKFNSHKDAKTLMEAFEKLQKLVSQLEIHGRNKADLEDKSLDDLFNSLKIYETKVKLSSSTSTKSYNLAFVSSSQTDITTNSVSVVVNVFAVGLKLPASPLPNIDVDDLEEMDLRWHMAMLTMRARRFLQKTGRNFGANGTASMGFDMTNVEWYNCHIKGHFAIECRSPKDQRRSDTAEPQRRTVLVETSTSNALFSQYDGTGSYDGSYQAKEEPKNFAFIAFSSHSSSSSSNNEYPLTGLETVEARLLVYKQNESIFKENFKMLNIEVQLRDTALVTIRQKLEATEKDRDDLKLKLENWPPSNLYDRFVPSGGYHAVSPPFTGTFIPPKPDLVFYTAPSDKTEHLSFNVQVSPTKAEQALSPLPKPSAPINEDWISDSEEDSQTQAPKVAPSFAQSTKHVKSPRHPGQPLQATIPVVTTVPVRFKTPCHGLRRNKKACFVCKSVDHLIKDCDFHSKKLDQRTYASRHTRKQHASLSPSKPVSATLPNLRMTRPRHAYHVVTKSNLPIRRHLPRSPSLKHSNSPPKVTAANAPMDNPQYALQDKRVIDSGCSRHMTGNMSYLFNFEELNGGYVAFEGNLKGGKITCKGKIKTGKLDFDDVYFVKELKFNLFSVSQMCDKKNSVLFTDTECLVLSPDFKLPDESQVLLRVPRENNMYNVNLKNIVPSRDLTCLFAKAIINESNLWHRRLGHISFKIINKLVKSNLVRVLPTKVFENDNSCVACKKGKQHRASCKSKHVSSIDQPFFRLHMDLFGPTFVNSLSKKSHCLVITDDYSIFTWVFFLTTKDETTPILKTFITGLENQLSLKAEAVNTACYVQNRVLVTKSHSKTPYELLHGRTPSIGFMRPFGCPVTILNTLDHLGKFQGKVDEGFLVGYSVCSKAFRVFNSRTRIVQETLHVNFLENKPNVAGTGPTWLFDIDCLSGTMNYHPVSVENRDLSSAGFQDPFNAEKAGEEVTQTYVLFPACSAQTKKQADKTEYENKGKSHVESFTGYRDLNTEFERCSNNSSNGVNAASSTVPTVGHNFINSTNIFSVAGPSNTAVSPTYGKSSSTGASTSTHDPDMPALEELIYSDDEAAVGAEADVNNLEPSIPVSPIPTTRIHKDHPISQIIGDLSSTTQTRSMDRAVKDQGGLSQMFDKDFHTCTFACFLSQEEPKRRAIGTKWVYENKKDERGIVIRNKARLVSQGHIQEEGINYEQVFAPVARIKAIRLYLAYASFMGFLVYQMDVKSAFLYGTIEKEVYVCQPLVFEDPDHPDKVYKVVKALYGLHQAPRACQDKYIAEILRKFGLTKGKSASTPIDTEKPLLKDLDGEDVDVHTYRLLYVEYGHWNVFNSPMRYLLRVEMVLNSPCPYWVSKNWLVQKKTALVQKQTALGKDISNPLMADNLPKIVWYSTHHITFMKSWLVQKKVALGKDISNPLMADNLPKNVWYSTHHIIFMKSWLVQKQTALGKDSSNPLTVDSLLKTIWFSIHHHLTNEVLAIPGQTTTGVKIPRSDEDRLEILELSVFVLQKDFWNTITVKQSADVTRLQALVDRKKVMISEAIIREVLQLDDTERVNCLPNEEIFTGLARMGSTMASAIICLSTGRKFNFSKYIFDSLVRNVDSNSKFHMYPRVGKGFSRVETPLFEGMLVVQKNVVEGIADKQVPDDTTVVAAQEVVTTAVLEDTALYACAALTLRVEHLERDKKAQTLEITKLKTRVKKLERVNKVKAFKLRRLKKEKTKEVMDIVDDAQVEGRQAEKQAEIYQIDLDYPSKVLSMQDDDSEVQEAVEVVTTTKLITEVVNAASTPVSTASIIIPTVEPNIPAVTVTAAPVKVAATSSRQRRGVVIRDPEEESTTVELDEAYARKLHEELNQDIDWDVSMDHVKQKAKEDSFIQIYQVMKKRPQTEAQARKNMMMYLKNTAGFKLDYFKGLPDEDDDVYTESTPLARKVPVVDYQIIHLNNKPRYKTIRADETHQLFSTSKPNNFSNEYLLTTLKTMFGRPDGQDNVWKSQRIERRYPLSKFTLEQMLNVVRLQMEEQSEMSLELLRFTRQQLQEGHFGVDAAKELEEKQLMLLSEVNTANVIKMLLS
uniref:Putative ribonuclease H-like domain-containing protein n=1 Tax=Tanacetum cinerariifolium TaxID=118510 RepID=A0A6L2J7Q6_TANCI|nr:putative ribonuclease H-like domain-containing protein [Tanacetum cinerariifolium]